MPSQHSAELQQQLHLRSTLRSTFACAQKSVRSCPWMPGGSELKLMKSGGSAMRRPALSLHLPHAQPTISPRGFSRYPSCLAASGRVVARRRRHYLRRREDHGLIDAHPPLRARDLSRSRRTSPAPARRQLVVLGSIRARHGPRAPCRP
jgi:hypothetical protein